MNGYTDVLDRILNLIAECERERSELKNDDEFLSLMAYKAVAMDLAQIGESVNYLRKKYPEKLATAKDIPWNDIVGLRNVIIHNYDGIIKEEIDDNLTQNLSDLKAAILVLREQAGGSSSAGQTSGTDEKSDNNSDPNTVEGEVVDK